MKCVVRRCPVRRYALSTSLSKGHDGFFFGICVTHLSLFLYYYLECSAIRMAGIVVSRWCLCQYPFLLYIRCVCTRGTMRIFQVFCSCIGEFRPLILLFFSVQKKVTKSESDHQTNIGCFIEETTHLEACTKGTFIVFFFGLSAHRCLFFSNREFFFW